MTDKIQNISLSKTSIKFSLRVGKNGLLVPNNILNHLRLVEGDSVVVAKGGRGRHGTFIRILTPEEFASRADCCPCYLCEKVRRWREQKWPEGWTICGVTERDA